MPKSGREPPPFGLEGLELATNPLYSSFGFILLSLSLFYCCQLSIWGWHADILTWLTRVENFLSEAEQCLEPFLLFPFFPGNMFIHPLASHCIKLT